MQENNDNQNLKPERGELSIEEIAEQSTNQPPDEIQRQMLRGDETRGDADKRDTAGSANSNKTPQRREEAKPDTN